MRRELQSSKWDDESMDQTRPEIQCFSWGAGGEGEKYCGDVEIAEIREDEYVMIKGGKCSS